MRLNVSVRVRLVASLLVLLSLTLGLGGFCHYRLSELRVAVGDLGDTALPSSRIVGRLAANFEACAAVSSPTCSPARSADRNRWAACARPWRASRST